MAVAYREEAVAGRIDGLAISDELRAVVRQTLVWIWKDEELHAEYLRGHPPAARRRAASSLVVYGRQVQGALSGWVTATEHHLDPRTAPLRTGAAGALVAVAGMTGRIPPALQRELHFQTFRRYCDLNVALEMTAELAYRRLVELAASDDERAMFDRIRDDEQRHTDAFRVLAAALTDDDGLADGWTDAERDRASSPRSASGSSRRRCAPRPRAHRHRAPRRFGSGAPVVVAQRYAPTATSSRCSTTASTAPGSPSRRGRAHRRDPGVVHARLRPRRPLRTSTIRSWWRASRGTCAGTASTTSRCSRRRPSTATCFAHRSVAEVARVLRVRLARRTGSSTSATTCAPFRFERGFVQQAISATWLDADLRIVMPKLRTDPTEFAHLCLSTLEGSTGPIDETFYAGRRVDFRSATMMLLDVAPPDFAVVDAWAPVADGPFGVMGCRHPAEVRHVYAGADALAVDEVVLADLGVADPRRAPIVRRAHHWFGFARAAGDGRRRSDPIAARPSCGARTRRRRCGCWARCRIPIYVYLSNRGELFVPAMDTDAFPPIETRRARRPARCAGARSARSGCGRRPDDPVALTAPGARRRRHDASRPTRGARALAIADSRCVRALAVPRVGRARRRARRSCRSRATFAELAARTGATRARSADRMARRRRRARASCGVIATVATRCAGVGRGRSPTATRCSLAHYRSMLDYQTGPYDAARRACLRGGPGEGRDDLDRPRHGDRRGVASRRQPFVTPFLRGDRASASPRRLLDVGCGTGVYLQAMLEAAPHATGDGIDLAADVIDDARARTRRRGARRRAGLRRRRRRRRAFATSTEQRYDLVTLINNIYYFDRDERVALYRQLRGVAHRRRRARGGDDADARFDRERAPAPHARQPGRRTRRSRATARSSTTSAPPGSSTVESTRLVPTEPFVGIRARAESVAPRDSASALGGIRTPNLLIRSQMLYPLSYERRWNPESLGGHARRASRAERPQSTNATSGPRREPHAAR